MSEDATALLRDRVRAAAADTSPLVIRGGGTKSFYGNAPVGETLDVSQHSGVLDYDACELVITARGGTTLVEIEQLLAERNQMLPFEPPHFGERATLGGCVAAGLSGPARAARGAVRDFVLGVTLLDGRGQVLRFGGQVMKNVAGYDVARLMAGSLGTLGILLHVSIKLLPRAVSEATLRFDCDQAEALQRTNALAGKPLPISASAWFGDALHLRLSGARAAVDKTCATLGGRLLERADADSLWTALREQSQPFFDIADDQVLWRLALPSTTPMLTLDSAMLIEWGGAQRWLVAPAGAAAHIRAVARRAGGHAVAFRRADDSVPAFDDLPETTLAIHRRLKAAFDPVGILNRGRLHSTL